MKPHEIKKFMDTNFWKFDYPESFLGDEPNSVHRDWDKAELKCCIATPNSYLVMVGNLGVPILVKAIEAKRENWVSERCFFLNSEREFKFFKECGVPFFSIESKHELKAFDMVGVSVTTKATDINFIQMLLLSGMAVRSKDRKETDPIIIRGGADWSNPMPWADIYDVCFCGEAEQAIVDLGDLILEGREKGWTKAKILYAMSLKVRGAFVPRFYQEEWKDGKLSGWKTLKGLPTRIERAYVKDLNKEFVYDVPIANYVKSHMGSGEFLISRGCFHFATQVILVNGSKAPIGEIVEKKRKVKVLSWNERKECYEFKWIIGWYKNGIGPFMCVQMRGDRRRVNTTPDHEWCTVEGYRKASELKIGDKVISRSLELTGLQRSILLGSVLGDGNVSISKGNGAHRFRILQAVDKMEHKSVVSKVMQPFVTYEGVWKRREKDVRKDQYCIAVSGTDILDNLAELVTENGRKKVKFEWIQLVDEIALAFWYMHDGNLANRDCVRLSTNAMDDVELDCLIFYLKDKWGIELRKTPGSPGTVLWARKYDSAKFLWLVAPYVFKEFDYKLPEWAQVIPKFKYRKTVFKPHSVGSTAEVVQIDRVSFKGKKYQRYDIEVEDNHNYLVKDVVVHNCQARCSFCMTSEGRLVTKRGLVSIADIEIGDEIGTQDGWKVIRNAFYVGKKPAMKVEFTGSLSMTGGLDHKVESVSGKWRMLSLLNKQTRVKVSFIDWSKGSLEAYLGEFRPTEKRIRKHVLKFPSMMTDKLAWLLGYWQGDGCGRKNTGYILVSTLEEKQRIEMLVEDLFGEVPKFVRYDGLSEKVLKWEFGCQMVEFLRYSRSNIRNSPKNYRAFLSGLIQADGWVNSVSGCDLVIAKEILADEVKDYGWFIGVRTSIGKYRAKGGGIVGELNSIRYVVHFSSHQFDLLGEKKRKVNERKCTIPAKEVHVVSLESVGIQDLYEITIDTPHQYYGNFISSHNCQEGVIYKPYREMSVEKVVQSLRSSMRESGAPSITCSAFCSSSHTQKRELIYRLLTEVSPKVDLLSQRCDEFAADRTFAMLTGLGKNRGVSLGVEGPSPRMRSRVDKHCTDSDILTATRWAIEAGYKNVKYYFISSLPGELEEDRQYLITLAKKIYELRNEYNAKELKMSFRFNWTELRNASHTAYQWIKPKMNERTLTHILGDLKKYGIRVGFGVHKSDDVILFSQIVHLGDRRLCEPIIRMVENEGLTYFNRINADISSFLEKYLSEAGLSVDDYIRERTKDEILPWDILDPGVSKESLWQQWQGDVNDGPDWPKCNEKCMNCGACDKEDLKIRAALYTKDQKEYDLENIPVLQTNRTEGCMRLKLWNDMEHRFVNKGVKLNLLRRACYKNDIPISPLLAKLASKSIKTEDWIGGVDYADLPMWKSFKDDNIIEKLNPHLKDFGMSVKKVLDLSYRATTLRFAFDLCLYSMVFPKEKLQEVNDKIPWFLSQVPIEEEMPDEESGTTKKEFVKRYPWVVRIPIMSIKGMIRKMVDTRALVQDVWVSQISDKYHIRMLARGMLNVHHFAQVLMRGETFTRARRLPAVRVEYFAPSNTDQFDFERGFCSLCDNKVGITMLNEVYGEGGLCPKHVDEQRGVLYK